MRPEDSYKQAINDKRRMDTMRHIKARQKLINELGETEGKQAFFDSLQKYRGFWSEDNYQSLINDMKEILRG